MDFYRSSFSVYAANYTIKSYASLFFRHCQSLYAQPAMVLHLQGTHGFRSGRVHHRVVCPPSGEYGNDEQRVPQCVHPPCLEFRGHSFGHLRNPHEGLCSIRMCVCNHIRNFGNTPTLLVQKCDRSFEEKLSPLPKRFHFHIKALDHSKVLKNRKILH